MVISDKDREILERVLSRAPFSLALRRHHDWDRGKEIPDPISFDFGLDAKLLLDFISNGRTMFSPHFSEGKGSNVEIFLSNSPFAPLSDFWINRNIRDLRPSGAVGTLMDYLTVLLVRRDECDLATAKKLLESVGRSVVSKAIIEQRRFPIEGLRCLVELDDSSLSAAALAARNDCSPEVALWGFATYASNRAKAGAPVDFADEDDEAFCSMRLFLNSNRWLNLSYEERAAVAETAGVKELVSQATLYDLEKRMF